MSNRDDYVEELQQLLDECVVALGSKSLRWGEIVVEIHELRKKDEQHLQVASSRTDEIDRLKVENAKLRKKTQQIHKDVEDLRMDTEETKEGIEWSDNAPVEVRMAWCNLLRSSGVDENRWFGP